MARNMATSPRSKELDEAMNKIVASSQQVGEAIRSWQESSIHLQKYAPSQEQVEKELTDLRARLDSEHTLITQRLHQLKLKREDETKKLSRDRISLHIQHWIEDETERQVKAHFEPQLNRVLPVSVEDQIKHVERRVESVDTALKNSQARSKNGTLNIQNGLGNLIEAVTMPGSSQPSKLFPANLQSLFYYSEQELVDLCKDYRLQVDPSFAVNMNRFLSHIGVRNVQYKVPPRNNDNNNKGKANA